LDRTLSLSHRTHNAHIHDVHLLAQMPLSLCSLAGRGQIHLILGPMFSGKTTELLRQLKRHSIAQHKCLLIKYAGDTRYSIEAVSTHDK